MNVQCVNFAYQNYFSNEMFLCTIWCLFSHLVVPLLGSVWYWNQCNRRVGSDKKVLQFKGVWIVKIAWLQKCSFVKMNANCIASFCILVALFEPLKTWSNFPGFLKVYPGQKNRRKEKRTNKARFSSRNQTHDISIKWAERFTTGHYFCFTQRKYWFPKNVAIKIWEKVMT